MPVLINNLITTSSSKIEIGKIKIQTFFGPNTNMAKQEVCFPEPFETLCISVIVSMRNGNGDIASFDIVSYTKDKFTLRSNVNNISTFVTAMGLLHFLTAHTKSAEKNFFFSALFF